MASNISYMGTKRELASAVADVVCQTRTGVMLDAFAGMGAIAEAVAPKRNVWTNDIQHFAHLVGKCTFSSKEEPLSAAYAADEVEQLYADHLACLAEAWPELSDLGAKALTVSTLKEMTDLNEQIHTLCIGGNDYPYSCFLQRYGGGYFSVRQTAEIDAIRYALDTSLEKGRFSKEQHDWALMALGRACLKVANTPGHFAQFLRPNATTFRRIQRQGKRSVWSEWLISIDALRPIGTPEWRRRNQATQSDSLRLLSDASKLHNVAAIYCDPTFWLKPRKFELLAVEVSDVLFPDVLKGAAQEIRHYDGLIRVLQVSPLEVYLAPEGHKRVGALRAQGFGLLTVDAAGVVTKQCDCVPLMQFISEADFEAAIKSLPTALKVRLRATYQTYLSNPVQGLQDAGQVAEGLVSSMAKQGAAAASLSNAALRGGLADLIDLMYAAQYFKDQRAALGAARGFIKFYRNPTSHAPKNNKEATSRVKNAREGFMNSLRIATQMAEAIKARGLKVVVYD